MESLGAAIWFLFGLKGGCCPGVWDIVGHMGYRGRAAWDCSGFIIGYLREEAKATKGRALGDLGRSKCGKQRSKGIKGTTCVEAGAS